MKKIIVFFAFAFSTLSLVAQSELTENETVDLKIVLRPASDTIIYNQFRDYVDFQKKHQPVHKPIFQTHLVRPKQIIHKKNEVIVIYSKEDYEKLERIRRYKRMKTMTRFHK